MMPLDDKCACCRSKLVERKCRNAGCEKHGEEQNWEKPVKTEVKMDLKVDLDEPLPKVDPPYPWPPPPAEDTPDAPVAANAAMKSEVEPEGKKDGFQAEERPEVTEYTVGKNVKNAVINIHPDCNFTINGQMVFFLYELRTAVRRFLEAAESKHAKIPAMHRKSSENVIKATFKGLGDILGVQLWP